MRLLFCLFAFVSLLIANTQAKFWLTYHKSSGFHTITLNLADDIYVYQNALKLLLDDEDITTMLKLPPPTQHNEWQVYEHSVDFDVPDFVASGKRIIDLHYQGCDASGLCYPPYTARLELAGDDAKIIYQNKTPNASNDALDGSFDDEGYFDGGFLLSVASFFLYGLLMSLTPCVLPMVPILSSIIVGKSSRLIASLVYVLGMSATYTVVGILAALFGQNISALFQNNFILLAFSAIFVLLACSSFGFIQFQMPSFISQRLSSSSSSLAGIFGVFVMGALSALIVGPCTAAPLAGALLYIANTHDIVLGGASLFALGLGMGVPLILIGFGFGFLKSGDFMRDINKIFGFVLLGVANFFVARVVDLELYEYCSYAILGFVFAFSFGVFASKDGLVSRLIAVLCYAVFGLSSILAYKAYESFYHQDLDASLEFELISSQDEFDRAISSSDTMVYFTASWCANCKELSSTTFKDKALIRALDGYKKLKIDITNPSDFSSLLLSKYQIFGPPAILFFENGKLKSKKIGYKTAEELLE